MIDPWTNGVACNLDILKRWTNGIISSRCASRMKRGAHCGFSNLSDYLNSLATLGKQDVAFVNQLRARDPGLQCEQAA